MIRTSMPRQARQTTVLPSPRRRFRVRIRLASGKKRTLTLQAAKYTLGNTPECHIRVPAPGEPAVQCLLLLSRGKLVARSWSPECRLNGRAFEIAELQRGDRLRIPGGVFSLLGDRQEKKRPASSKKRGANTGKRLVGEIGKRLAHLEERLVRRQMRLTRRLEASAQALSQHAAPLPASVTPTATPLAAESAPSPVVLAGLSTLRSAVEELRGRVEEVVQHSRTPLESTPTIDPETLLDAASQRLQVTVETSLREERTRTALRYEQISRDFDRIGERLGEVEQKLHSPQADTAADQIRPVSEAVEFVRAGLQAIEDRQSQGAARLESLAIGLEGLRQTTQAQLVSITEKVSVIPSLQQVEEALATVSGRVEFLAQEIADREERVFTRDDAAPLLAQLEAATAARQEFEDRLVDLGRQVTDLEGTWTGFRSETREQLQALAERIDALPAPGDTAPAPVDLTLLETGLASLEEKFAAQLASIADQTEARGTVEARLEATQLALQELREEGAARAERAGQIDQLAAALSQVRGVAEGAAEEARAAQADLLRQLIALEDRCLFLESELARMSRFEAAAPVAEPPPTASPSTAAEETSPSGLIASAYYSNPDEAESDDPALSSYHDFRGLSSMERREEAPVIESPVREADATAENSAEYSAEPRSDEGSDDLVPDSVVEHLRKSGIWKEESLQEEKREAPEDPRDVVGTSFHADATPPAGLDPGKAPAEQLAPAPWGASPAPRGGEGDEESIDAYMQRLMQRVSGQTGEVTGAMAVAEHLQKMKSQAARTRAADLGVEGEHFEYAPRVAAPEKSADLSAFRELAMTSANVNIQNYHAAAKAKKANEKWLVVVVAMICATGLLYVCVNYKSDWNYLAAGAAFVVALYWAIQASLTSVAAKRLSTPRPQNNATPEEAGEHEAALAEQPPRAAGPGLLDLPSSGETFQTLLAERERHETMVEPTQASGDAEFYRTLNQLMPEQRPPS